MDKLRSFSGRISAETCLKMYYFGSKISKSPRAGGSLLASGGWRLPFTFFGLSPDLHLHSMTRKCARPYFY